MSARVVFAVARSELRRSWLALVAIGVLAGFAAGVALGTFALARRTTSAPQRLATANQLDDARVALFAGGPGAAEEIADLPAVRSSWIAQNAVGQLVGSGRQFASISFGPTRPSDLFTPVVAHGRAPAEDAPDEVLVTEALAEQVGLRPGDVLRMKMLLRSEVFQFDTGFGEPDGPELALKVTGLARLSSRGGDGFGPIFATPAFAAKYGELSAGPTVLLRLEPGPQSRAQLDAALVRISAEAGQSDEASGFGPLRAVYPTAAVSPQVGAARGVLGGGLLVLGLVAGAAGLLVTAQALARHASAHADDQRIEAALGLVRAERVAARLIPALTTVVVAMALAVAGVAVAGAVQPLGALGAYEPRPGWLPDLPVAALGGLAVALIVVLLVVATTVVAERRAGPRTGTATTVGPAALLRRPSALFGTALAFGGRGSGARGSILTAMVAVAGIVATATFAASLHRVEHTPARYGWTADFSVADIKSDEIFRLAADPRIGDVRVVSETSVRLDGALTDAFAYSDRKGALTTTVVDGRLPRTANEVALGEHSARRLGVAPGDQVPLGVENKRATVTGIVVVPPMVENRLGAVMVLTPPGLSAVAEAVPSMSALIGVREGVDPEAVRASYGADLETTPAQPPAEVRNLIDLGALPVVLELFLAALAFAALAHAVTQTVRRRRRDFAVVRALGLTPRQVGGALLVMGASIALAGLLAGIPLGLALGRVAWGQTASTAGLAPDAAVPVVVLAWIVPVVVLLACAVAALPALRTNRLSPSAVLREE